MLQLAITIVFAILGMSIFGTGFSFLDPTKPTNAPKEPSRGKFTHFVEAMITLFYAGLALRFIVGWRSVCDLFCMSGNGIGASRIMYDTLQFSSITGQSEEESAYPDVEASPFRSWIAGMYLVVYFMVSKFVLLGYIVVVVMENFDLEKIKNKAGA